MRVKTPVGNSQSFSLEQCILQGSVLGPLKCTVQVDSVRSEFVSDSAKSKVTYKYKDIVNVPPLSMMDDVFTVTKCGLSSVVINATLNAKFEGKKLTMSKDKCQKLHINKKKKENEKCDTKLYAHNEVIKEVETLTYLG